MDLSVFLAEAWGLYLTIVGVGLLLNAKAYKKLLEAFSKEPALLYLAALMSLLVGILHVLTHNAWSLDWVGLVTLFGWLALAKGFVFVLFPAHASKVLKMKANENFLTLGGVVAIVVGVYLLQVGF